MQKIMAELGAARDAEVTSEGVRVWNGEGGAEILDRSDRRQQILDAAGVEDVDDLEVGQRKMFYGTMAYTRSFKRTHGMGKVW